MTEERTPLQELERRALTGNRFATVQVISALRRYRAAANKLVAQQNKDGFSTEALTAFEDEVEEIENDVEEDT
jgi:hypothetical protein